MRILAIRGSNLASLAAAFELDLTVEPLGGAGLFAITGETGAGKSTILDALCLALYGEYPRIAVGRREEAPDPSGRTLTVNDPRAILRRGTSHGYAQVDFIGQDGQGYRACWEACRARGKANGRLQPEDRTLLRLDDASAVATGKVEVRKAVEARTDLSFDQFRRTVLLAQGEFDAFLLAPESERADLLEKVTGTEVYSEISRRVHEGAERHRRALAGLQERRAGLGLLDPGVRKALICEQGEVEAKSEAKAAEEALLTVRLDHAGRVAMGRRNAIEAEAKVRQAEAASEAAGEDRARLAALEAAEPLRTLDAAVRAAQGRLSEAETEDCRATEGCETAGLVAEDSASLLSHAEAADEASEETFKHFGPIWSEAERLDAEIATAAAEVNKAERAAEEAEATLRARAAHLSALDARLSATTTTHAGLAAQLAADNSRAPLCDRAEEIAGLLDKRARFQRDLKDSENAAAAAQADVESLTALQRAETDKIGQLRNGRDTLARQLGEHRDSLGGLDEAALHSRDAALVELLEAGRETEAACRCHTEAAEALAEAEAVQRTAAEKSDAAGQRHKAAERDHAAHTLARGEISALAELADETLSAEAIRLRSLLVPDQPCPVCGSADHPHVGADGALTEIVGVMRRRREALDESVRGAESAMTEARGAMAAAEAELSTACREAATADAERVAAIATYADLRPRLGGAVVRAGLGSSVPAELSGGARTEIAAILTAAKEAREAVAGPLGQARSLRGEIDLLRGKLDLLGKAMDDAVGTHEGHAAKLRVAEIAGAAQTAARTNAEERLVSITRELGAFLAAADITVADLDRNPAGSGRRLAEVGEAYGRQRQSHAALERTIQDLAPEHFRAVSERDSAKAAVATALSEAKQRRELLAAKQEARAGLLKGEATGTHRTRINEERKAARAERDRAGEGRMIAATALAGAQARVEAAVAALSGARERHAAARAAFIARCDELGLAPEQAGELLAVPADMRAALRGRLDDLAGILASAQTELATRRADLARLLTDGTDDIDVEGVSGVAAGIKAEIRLLHERLGAIRADLLRDDEALRRAAEADDEIQALSDEVAAWTAVDDAIGSATGDKFRRFAQGVTFDHLVHFANDQLAALSPRYRLSRSATSDLALHVVDRDMGHEVRTTRSLSGGERFLVSLALALALSGLEGRESFVDTLFIDEGFGSLDAETLDLAVDALETLQGSGRKVGVITHVAAMIDRIAVQVRVEKRGNGRSTIRTIDGSRPLLCP